MREIYALLRGSLKNQLFKMRLPAACKWEEIPWAYCYARHAHPRESISLMTRRLRGDGKLMPPCFPGFIHNGNASLIVCRTRP